jgi:curli biogenesis system outer membrane secretion channel CsgG
MNVMNSRYLLLVSLSALPLLAQTPAAPVTPKPSAIAPAKPAAPKPAVTPPSAPKRPAAAAAGTTMDTIIELVKGGMSETMIIQTLRREGKVFTFSALDALKLQKAGVSENILRVMLDPKSAVAAEAPPPPPAPAPAPEASAAAVVPASSTPATPPAPVKRRLAVSPFDYSAVRSAVTFWFKNDVNIGQGIRAMLTDRLSRAGKIRILEREKVDKIMGEQDFGASNRVAQGTKARIGKIIGADALLMGDIVTFGRDDVKKQQGIGGALFGHFAGGWAQLKKEEKAVVVINFRIVDAETSEVIETGEARGESSRKSKNWGAVLGTPGAVGGAGASMESSNFAETIIGEATKDAVDKLAEELNRRIPALPAKQMDIEGRVAKIVGDGTLYLSVGSVDGVLPSDRFEIHQILETVQDPVTKEVLDQRTQKVGELAITNVRDRVTVGRYSGGGLDPNYAKGYTARKVN